MDFHTELFINNEYVPSSTGEVLTVYNPSDDTLVSDQIQAASEADVDEAVAAAKAAFPAWKATSGEHRSKLMLKLADLIERDAERIAKLESISMGMPIALAKFTVLSGAACWRYYAGLTDKLPGETFPDNGDGLFRMVYYEPLGVCAGISAWNATQIFHGFKIAPAVAVGNTFVFKSSEKSPLGTLALGDLVKEAGFPPGVINFVSGGGKVGALLASHMEIAKISFTGSTAAGRLVQIAAAKSNLKHCTLELGGKSPSIIFDDAELENAVHYNSQGFLLNSGQVCSAGSRVLVQEGIAPRFIEALRDAFLKFGQAMGDPAMEQTFLGPLADKAQFDRVTGFLQDGKKEGVEMITGGVRKGDKGQFIEPTVLLNPDLNSRLYRDEIFGPVLTVRTFKTEEEAIQLANDTTYGLSSAVYTNDITRALRVASKIEAGTVAINTTHSLSPLTPIGGKKQSGYGRENGLAGIKAYLDMKTVHVKTDLVKKE